MSININSIRADFPILERKVYDKPLIYFDNGATTQKPYRVVDAITKLYSLENSSIHRGVHYLSEQMTERYENARITIQEFINAKYPREIIFTSGTTGSINAIAFSFGEQYVHEGDEVLITEMEHHANIVPWQMMCQRRKAKLKVLPFNDQGVLEIDSLEARITGKTKIIAVSHVSNSLGTINPVKRIIEIAHQHDVPVLVDGAQAVQHIDVDVQDLDCDFYVFSGHKIYGPNGVGVLYGKEKWIYEMPPYQGGGDMVDCVKFENTTYNELPFKFEAGTTNYIGAVGLAESIRYISGIGLNNIREHENDLLVYATKRLNEIEGLRIYGQAPEKIATFSFLLDGIHPYDAGMVIDKLGIAIRTGTHCNQPVMDHFDIEGTMRASLAMYNTREEIDVFIEGLQKVVKMFR